MSLNCFFGLELKPDGVPVTPVIPAGSSLVITQCAVTSVVPPSGSAAGAAAYGPVTLYVQSSDLPSRLAVCTLAPAQQVTYCPLQLIFTKRVTLTLLPRESAAGAASSTNPVPYPTVHLTGYFERDDSDDEEEVEEAEELDEVPEKPTPSSRNVNVEPTVAVKKAKGVKRNRA